MVMELRAAPRKVEPDLRGAAENLVVPEGFTVEILGGRIVVSAAPVPKHFLISDLVYDQFVGRLGGGRRPSTGGPSIAPDPEGGDYAIPDLLVTTKEALVKDVPILHADDVDFVMEVVSKGNADKDTKMLPEIYAEWGIPVYLLVDPRTGDIVLHTNPVAGIYRQQLPFRFGDEVALPDRLDGIVLQTAEFPRYPR